MGPPMGRGRGGTRYGGAQYGQGPPPPDYNAHADSPVVMVYGLEPTKINADRVFNVFCLFGNVERVSGRWGFVSLKGISYGHQSCICLIKNTIKTVMLNIIIIIKAEFSAAIP